MPLQLFPYQYEGAAYAAERARCGVHDDMGVGKTAEIIEAACSINARRGIVICPASVRTNWLNEFRKFSRYDYRIAVGKNVHDFIAWSRGRYHHLITSYELAKKWSDSIYNSGEPLDFVALDEAHYLKNHQSQRSQIILGKNLDGVGGLVNWAEHVWHVTGTAMPNDPLDIFTFLRLCKATPLGLESFTRRYFYSARSAWGSRQSVRPAMLEELQYVIDNNRIRRTKAQVGIQLPPIFLTTAVVDGDTTEIKEMLRAYPGLEQAIVDAIEMGGLSFLDAQHIATLRRLVGEAKAIPYAHMLHTELESSNEKRVIFGNHVEALDSIHRYLLRKGMHSILLREEKDATQAVDRFNTDDRIRAIFGNMRSAGVGLNMTGACEIDIFESDWAPAPNAQAIMRVHRIGQTRNVRARFIILERSLDEVITRIVAAKTAAIAEIERDRMNSVPVDEIRAFV